jgi:mono/diheme cytochrome c family protein
MGKVLKWIGIGLGALVLLIVLAVGALFIRAQMMINKAYAAPAVALTIPTDAASVARGQHLITAVAACVDCHGQDLGGGVVIDDPALGRIVAPNLTSGGRGGALNDADFARVLRYGVKTDGHSVLVMPANDYTHFSDSDLASVIAYIRSVPAVPDTQPGHELRPLGYILVGAGQLPIVIAERIDFATAGSPPVTPDVSMAYGQYLTAIACTGCHGEGLSGGPIPGAPPDFLPAANLTPSGEVGGWTESDFINTIRTGQTPSGRELVGDMPWQTFAKMTDDELRAIWLYIDSVPARPAGTH